MENIDPVVERRIFDAGWLAGANGHLDAEAWDRYCGRKPLAVGDRVQLRDDHLDMRINEDGGRGVIGEVRQEFNQDFLSIEFASGMRLRMHRCQLQRFTPENAKSPSQSIGP